MKMTGRRGCMKRIGGALLAGCLMMGTLSGCSDRKTVDYDLDGKEETEERNGSGGMAQFADAEKWTLEENFTGTDGKQFKLSVNADIKVPAVDSMSVVEVEETVADAEFKERLMKAFYNGDTVYYHDPAHQTKEELEAAISASEEGIEGMNGYLESMAGYEKLPGYAENIQDIQNQIAELEEALQEYQEIYETAGDEYTPAEEFDSCNDFIGYRDGVAYGIHFPEAGDNSGITISPWSVKDVLDIPESLKDYEHVTWMPGAAEEGDNQCSLSMEDARKLADELAELCGGSNQVLCEAAGLEWYGWNEGDETITTYSDTSVLYGYCFTYGNGVDGLAFQSFGTYADYVDLDTVSPSDEGFYDLLDSMEIMVVDDGVFITMQNPITVNRITEQVEMLPLSSIEDILKNEVMENSDRYHYNAWSQGVTKSFNLLELIYFRVKNNDTPGSYSYVPAWRLSQEASGYNHPILVNAIDGSVIYLEEELAGWE